MRFFPIYACAYAAGGHKKSGFICCHTRGEVRRTLHAPQTLAAVFLPKFAPTSLVVCVMRAVTPYNARHDRPYAFFYAMFFLVAACFSSRRARMGHWFEGNVAGSSCRQAHIRALEVRSARQFCAPVTAAVRHMLHVCQRMLRMLFALCLPWPAQPSLPLPAIPVRRDDNASPLRSKQTGMAGFPASPRRSP